MQWHAWQIAAKKGDGPVPQCARRRVQERGGNDAQKAEMTKAI